MKSTAPTATYPQSPADKAAHLAARGPIRVHNGDSDPDIDEALRRVQTEVAYIERDAQLAADVAKDLAAGDGDDDGNWIPNVAPPTSVTERMWDAVMDGYSLPSAA